MSLESSVIDLSNQVLGLAGDVRATLPQVRSEQQAFISNWGINGYTVLEVGAGKAFATIPDAFYSLNGKTLMSDVLIRVADGVYPSSGFILENHAYAHRIRIQGNVANPAACVLQMSGVAQGVVLRNLKQMGFSGFKITGNSVAGNYTYRGLRVDKLSSIYSDNASIVVDGCVNGIEVSDMSMLVAMKSKITNCAGNSVLVDGCSQAFVNDIAITGKGATTLYTTPQGSVQKGQGVLAIDCSRVWLGDAAVIDSVYKGIYANNNSYLYGNTIKVNNVGVGIHTDTGASLAAPNALVTNATEKSYCAAARGVLMAQGAKAEGGAIGFESVLGAFIYANDGYAKNCSVQGYVAGAFGQIEAYNTNANSTGNGVKYVPSTTEALGNSNGMIRFS